MHSVEDLHHNTRIFCGFFKLSGVVVGTHQIRVPSGKKYGILIKLRFVKYQFLQLDEPSSNRGGNVISMVGLKELYNCNEM